MNDRELLELVAKVAGVKKASDTDLYYKHENPEEPYQITGVWNPLTDDGDAFRLAVKLGLDIELHGMLHTFQYGQVTSVEHGLDSPDCEFEVTDSDPCAATRRAIVRAAAEIGRTK